MTIKMVRHLVVAAALLLGGGAQLMTPGHAANPFLEGTRARATHPYFEANPFRSFPECDADAVLNQIASRFRFSEDRTWNRGFLIEDITSIKSLRQTTAQRPERVSRRYCQAEAQFSNGRSGKLHYLIEEGAGFVGAGYGVSYCIDGLDPWRVRDGFCRTVRPF